MFSVSIHIICIRIDCFLGKNFVVLGSHRRAFSFLRSLFRNNRGKNATTLNDVDAGPAPSSRAETYRQIFQ